MIGLRRRELVLVESTDKRRYARKMSVGVCLFKD
jgi:hypothetical protein